MAGSLKNGDTVQVTQLLSDTESITLDGVVASGGILCQPVFLDCDCSFVLFGEGRNLYTLQFPQLTEKKYIMSFGSPIKVIYPLLPADSSVNQSLISADHQESHANILAIVDNRNQVHFVDVTKMTVSTNDRKTKRNYSYSCVSSYTHQLDTGEPVQMNDVIVSQNADKDIVIMSSASVKATKEVAIYMTTISKDARTVTKPTSRILGGYILGSPNASKQFCLSKRYIIGCLTGGKKATASAFIYDFLDCKILYLAAHANGQIVKFDYPAIDSKHGKLAFSRTDNGEVFIFDLFGLKNAIWNDVIEQENRVNLADMMPITSTYTVLPWHAHRVRHGLKWLNKTTLYSVGHEGVLVIWTINDQRWTKQTIPAVACIGLDINCPASTTNSSLRDWVIVRRADNSYVSVNISSNRTPHRYAGIHVPLTFMQYYGAQIDPLDLGGDGATNAKLTCKSIYVGGNALMSGPYGTICDRKDRKPIYVDINPVNNIVLYNLGENVSYMSDNADAKKLDGVPRRYFGGNHYVNYPFEIKDLVQIGNHPLLLYLEGRTSMKISGMEVECIQRFRIFEIVAEGSTTRYSISPIQDVGNCHTSRVVYVGSVKETVVSVDVGGLCRVWGLKINEDHYSQTRMSTVNFFNILQVCNVQGSIRACATTASRREKDIVYVTAVSKKCLFLLKHSIKSPADEPEVLLKAELLTQMQDNSILVNMNVYDKGSRIIITCCCDEIYAWYAYNTKSNSVKSYVAEMPKGVTVSARAEHNNRECIVVNIASQTDGKRRKLHDPSFNEGRQEILEFSIGKTSVEQIRCHEFTCNSKIISALYLPSKSEDKIDEPILWVQNHKFEWIQLKT